LSLDQPADHVTHVERVIAASAGRLLLRGYAIAHVLVELVLGPPEDVAALLATDPQATGTFAH
jgi:hypothetical protein